MLEHDQRLPITVGKFGSISRRNFRSKSNNFNAIYVHY